MSVTLDSFSSWVRPMVPTCPVSVIRGAILRAAIEFIQKSQVWRKTLDPLPLIKSFPIVEITPPHNTRIVSIEAIGFHHRNLAPMTEDEIARFRPDWRTRKGTPDVYVPTDETTIRLSPIPTQSKALALYPIVILSPSSDAAKLPDFMLTQWHDAVVAGALFRLYLMPKKPWSEPELGAEQQRLYARELQRAQNSVNKAFSDRSLRVQARRFA